VGYAHAGKQYTNHTKEGVQMRRIGEGFDQLALQLRELKELAAQREPIQRPTVDLSNLSGDNLEEMGALDPSAPYLTVRSIPHCGRCDEGFERIPNTVNHVRMCRRCEIPRRRAKRLNDLRLPLDAIGMSFRSYQYDSALQQERVEQLLNHMAQPQGLAPCLFLWGSLGNGKTSLLYSMSRWACFTGRTGLKVEFKSHTDLINRIKRGFGDQSKRDPLEGWLDRTDLLLLDELGGIGGGAKRSEWYRSITSEMIGRIYERWRAGRLAVVVTTNLNPRGVAQLFDNNPAILSRLNSIFGQPVQLTGPDQRNRLNELKHWGLT